MNTLKKIVGAVRMELRAALSTLEELEQEERLMLLEKVQEQHKKDAALFLKAFMELSDKYKQCRKDRADLLMAAKDVTSVAGEATRKWNMGEDLLVNQKLMAIANKLRDSDPRLVEFHNVIERMEKENES